MNEGSIVIYFSRCLRIRLNSDSFAASVLNLAIFHFLVRIYTLPSA